MEFTWPFDEAPALFLDKIAVATVSGHVEVHYARETDSIEVLVAEVDRIGGGKPIRLDACTSLKSTERVIFERIEEYVLRDKHEILEHARNEWVLNRSEAKQRAYAE